MTTEREQAIADTMARTGKTREQIEAFIDMIAGAMGWAPKLTDAEKRQRLDTFLGDTTQKDR